MPDHWSTGAAEFGENRKDRYAKLWYMDHLPPLGSQLDVRPVESSTQPVKRPTETPLSTSQEAKSQSKQPQPPETPSAPCPYVQTAPLQRKQLKGAQLRIQKLQQSLPMSSKQQQR